jgi:predicted amidohydrolase
MPKLNVATCQFPVSADIARNARMMREMIRNAAKKKADIINFPETCLTGYAGTDFDGWTGFSWDLLKSETTTILTAAKESKTWIVFGSTHPLSKGHQPHNCLYVINPTGKIHDRYDKCFCTGGDLDSYSPGDHLVAFDVKGVKCGLLICFDVRFPEIYRAYHKKGVQLMLHPFYNARNTGYHVRSIIMRATIQARAATNAMWISAPNASGRHQDWPSVFVTPDGIVESSLKQNCSGLMINTLDTNKDYYDPSKAYRKRAMRGILHSGRLVKDPRSRDRKHF